MKRDVMKADGACMSAAVEKRDNSIIASVDTYATSVKTALQTRRDALKAAWLLTEKDARESAIKAAHKAFQGTWKKAADGVRKARKEAWSVFKNDAKACKLPVGAESSGEGADLKI